MLTIPVALLFLPPICVRLPLARSCFSVYMLYGAQFLHNLLMIPTIHSPPSSPSSAIALASPHSADASPPPDNSVVALSLTAAAGEMPGGVVGAGMAGDASSGRRSGEVEAQKVTRTPLDLLDLLWYVCLDDVMARHFGMMVKAVSLLVAPFLAVSHRRITQVCVCVCVCVCVRV